ncbi:MAG: DUF6242 domain-containing protein, partial [Bacteroidales bacterium]|nr:DUF6242 domain-containing protein [Bacteroidales bacterium]
TNKSYFVKVNVHQLYGDTVVWKYYTHEQFDASSVVDQRVSAIDNNLYWFAEQEGGSQQVRMGLLDGDIRQWSDPVSVNGNVKLGSIITYNKSLYAVSKEGELLMSQEGQNWNSVSTAFHFHNLLGVQPGVELDGKRYSDEYMAAIVKHEEQYHFAYTFDGDTWTLAPIGGNGSTQLPEGFPIDGYTLPISVNAQPKNGNITSRLYVVGGVDQQGNLVNSTWSCDGVSWVEFPQQNLPAMQKASIVTYTRKADKPGLLWILHPGLMANGKVSRELWFSENSGVTWKKLSREYSEMADTQNIAPIACGSAFYSPKDFNIYFFGGIDEDGRQQSSIYGGQYRLLNFSPIK